MIEGLPGAMKERSEARKGEGLYVRAYFVNPSLLLVTTSFLTSMYSLLIININSGGSLIWLWRY